MTTTDRDLSADEAEEQSAFKFRLRHGGELYPGERIDEAMGLIASEDTDEQQDDE